MEPINRPQHSFIKAPSFKPLNSLFQKCKSLILKSLESIPTNYKKLHEHSVTSVNSSNNRIRQTASKIYTILFIYTLSHDVPVLVSAKNIASPGVVWRGDDVEKSKELIAKIRDPQFLKSKGLPSLASHQISQLENFKVKGGIKTGICLGASLSVIKALSLATISSEEALIKCVSQYKNGFSAESAGLHSISKTDLDFATRYETHELNTQIKKIKDRNLKEMGSEILGLKNYAAKSNHLHHIASLIDLEIRGRLENHDKTFFTGITHSDVLKEKFNQLEKGYHQLIFDVDDEVGHAIVFIKEEFGTYLLDPNFGLLKCDPNNPAQDLCKLFKDQYPGKSLANQQKENHLEIYRYDLYSK